MKTSVLDLRPTQFALGMREVEAKVKKLQAFKSKELDSYLLSHPVPVVANKDKNLYIIDHHHLVRACWECGVQQVTIDTTTRLDVEGDASFWNQMKSRNLVYLFDQFGNGPHDPKLLPLDVRGMGDDFFRSLAWAVREQGGFKKTAEPFCEFKWANFFREHIPIRRSRDGFEKATKEALTTSGTQEAAHLPGFQGKK